MNENDNRPNDCPSVPSGRIPLQDLDIVSYDEDATSTTNMMGLRKRKVSFNNKFNVKEFNAEEQTAHILHAPEYEEPLCTSSGSPYVSSNVSSASSLYNECVSQSSRLFGIERTRNDKEICCREEVVNASYSFVNTMKRSVGRQSSSIVMNLNVSENEVGVRQSLPPRFSEGNDKSVINSDMTMEMTGVNIGQCLSHAMKDDHDCGHSGDESDMSITREFPQANMDRTCETDTESVQRRANSESNMSITSAFPLLNRTTDMNVSKVAPSMNNDVSDMNFTKRVDGSVLIASNGVSLSDSNTFNMSLTKVPPLQYSVNDSNKEQITFTNIVSHYQLEETSVLKSGCIDIQRNGMEFDNPLNRVSMQSSKDISVTKVLPFEVSEINTSMENTKVVPVSTDQHSVRSKRLSWMPLDLTKSHNSEENNDIEVSDMDNSVSKDSFEIVLQMEDEEMVISSDNNILSNKQMVSSDVVRKEKLSENCTSDILVENLNTDMSVDCGVKVNDSLCIKDNLVTSTVKSQDNNICNDINSGKKSPFCIYDDKITSSLADENDCVQHDVFVENCAKNQVDSTTNVQQSIENDKDGENCSVASNHDCATISRYDKVRCINVTIKDLSMDMDVNNGDGIEEMEIVRSDMNEENSSIVVDNDSGGVSADNLGNCQPKPVVQGESVNNSRDRVSRNMVVCENTLQNMQIDENPHVLADNNIDKHNHSGSVESELPQNVSELKDCEGMTEMPLLQPDESNRAAGVDGVTCEDTCTLDGLQLQCSSDSISIVHFGAHSTILDSSLRIHSFEAPTNESVTIFNDTSKMQMSLPAVEGKPLSVGKKEALFTEEFRNHKCCRFEVISDCVYAWHFYRGALTFSVTLDPVTLSVKSAQIKSTDILNPDTGYNVLFADKVSKKFQPFSSQCKTAGDVSELLMKIINHVEKNDSFYHYIALHYCNYPVTLIANNKLMYEAVSHNGVWFEVSIDSSILWQPISAEQISINTIVGPVMVHEIEHLLRMSSYSTEHHQLVEFMRLLEEFTDTH